MVMATSIPAASDDVPSDHGEAHPGDLSEAKSENYRRARV
jgi:hypothetical protein